MTPIPDLTGPVGRAWMLPAEQLTVNPHCHGAWFMHLPPAHPFWPRYLLSVVDLYEDPNLPPPVRHAPGMRWELMIVALNPDQKPQPNQPETWVHLTPLNLVWQFGQASREQALTLLDRVANWCVIRQALGYAGADFCLSSHDLTFMAQFKKKGSGSDPVTARADSEVLAVARAAVQYLAEAGRG